jgi:sugar phosphate isomerase/epimerase
MNGQSHSFPKLHNAMWPGLVGKGPDSEPPIDLDTMLDLTAKAEVNGVRFDGVDLFLFDPHVSIDASDSDLKRLAEKIRSKGFVVGSVVAPVWPPTGGGSAMGSAEERKQFVQQVRKGCRIAAKLRELGVRPYGIVRIDSAASVSDWAKDPEGNSKRIAQTFREACRVAESFGERLAAEGEICWGGMHSWKQMVKLLELVDRPRTLGFQADMAHTLLYTMGYNAPEDAILPQDYDWKDQSQLENALQKLTNALRPWTIDFHVAQNDATVKGSGSHEKTGHHCLADDPAGKLDIPRHAGYWLRDENGRPTNAVQHVCWDGCMFPNEVMMKQETWNNILSAMVAVRNAHGWSEQGSASAAPAKNRPGSSAVRVSSGSRANAKLKAKPTAKTKATAAKKKTAAKKPAARAARPAPKASAKSARKPASKAAKAPAKAAKKAARKPAARKPARPASKAAPKKKPAKRR